MTWEEKGIAIARHNGTGKKINKPAGKYMRVCILNSP